MFRPNSPHHKHSLGSVRDLSVSRGKGDGRGRAARSVSTCTYPQALVESRWPGTPYRHIQTRMAAQERVRVSYEAPDSACCQFKTAQKQFIKCHFYVGSEPCWAWVCSVSDPQDSINELLNCILQSLLADEILHRSVAEERIGKQSG